MVSGLCPDSLIQQLRVGSKHWFESSLHLVSDIVKKCYQKEFIILEMLLMLVEFCQLDTN